MDKRIAVVTGGIGGLGTAICRRLADDGRTVVALDLAADASRLARFESAIDGRDVSFLPCDAGDFETSEATIATIEREFGPVSILVNGAGITRDAMLRKMERQQWQDVLRINLDSVFNLSRQVVHGMCERGFGRIVNISSVNGQTGQFGQTNYAAAKAGMHGFTMALAREVARKGVTVNSVSPGYIDTEMTRAIRADVRERIVADIPAGRMGRPEDIANVVGFLCGDASDYITGANVPVNGGLFMSF